MQAAYQHVGLTKLDTARPAGDRKSLTTRRTPLRDPQTQIWAFPQSPLRSVLATCSFDHASEPNLITAQPSSTRSRTAAATPPKRAPFPFSTQQPPAAPPLLTAARNPNPRSISAPP